MFESAGADYWVTDKIVTGGLEEISEGEMRRLVSLMERMGFSREDHDDHSTYCEICHHGPPEEYSVVGGPRCPAVSFDFSHGRLGPFVLEHIVCITKTQDDYWQVQFGLYELEYDDYREALFRCDDIRGLESFLSTHVAAKLEEAKALGTLMEQVFLPGSEARKPGA